MLETITAALVAFWAELLLKLDFWFFVGIFGQVLFGARFLIQWIHSERVGRSEIPIVFWFFSLGGSLILLVYAVSRADPVIILGQSTGMFIYARNLMLIFREKRQKALEEVMHELTGD